MTAIHVTVVSTPISDASAINAVVATQRHHSPRSRISRCFGPVVNARNDVWLSLSYLPHCSRLLCRLRPSGSRRSITSRPGFASRAHTGLPIAKLAIRTESFPARRRSVPAVTHNRAASTQHRNPPITSRQVIVATPVIAPATGSPCCGSTISRSSASAPLATTGVEPVDSRSAICRRPTSATTATARRPGFQPRSNTVASWAPAFPATTALGRWVSRPLTFSPRIYARTATTP